MKKFFMIILTVALLFSALPIFAADGTETIRLKNTSAEGTVFIAVYTAQNRLSAVAEAQAEMEDKDALVSLPSGLAPAGGKLGIYIPKTNVFVIPEEAAPSASPAAPAQTEKPGQEPKETLHPAYESEAAAMLAFMVVKDVTSGLEDDMPVTIVNAYYQGRETSFIAEEGAALGSVPDAYNALDGMEIADLQEGDVIYCRASLSGQLVGVDLLFRPMEEDIVAQLPACGFEKLYTVQGQTGGRWPALQFGGKPANKNQYAFGVVKERSGKNILILTDAAGLEKDALYLGLLDNTVVYVYDKTSRNRLSIGAIGDIFPSVIPADTKDEDGNIIKWNAEDEHHYAFVRLYNGIAVDIVLYQNY